MENNLMVFEGNDVEVVEFDGKVLFNPRHVGECLEITEDATKKAVSRMNEKQVIKLTNSKMTESPFRKLHNTGENFLTESGVYKLIFKSQSEKAEKFQDWVTDEVLPSIRKNGAYMTDITLENAIQNPDFMIGLLTNLKEEQIKRKQAEELVATQQKEITYKEDIIIGLVDEITVADKRRLITQVVRKAGKKYADRYNAIYSQFEMKYHCDVKRRMENYNETHKPKMKSKMDYIDKVMNKIPELYEITCKLFEGDVNALVSELYDIQGDK